MRNALYVFLFQTLALLTAAQAAPTDPPLTPDQIAAYLLVGYTLGEDVSGDGVYSLISYTGVEAGYVFETRPIAPLPGFAGAPIDMLVMIDTDARFQAFLGQYAGQSITEPFVVGKA